MELTPNNLVFRIAKATGSDENEAAVLPEMLSLLQKFSDLEGATSPMMFVGFSDQINDLLKQVKDDANLITNYLTKTQKRKTEISDEQVNVALSNLENIRKVDSKLNSLFQSELPLRNFIFFRKKICSLIYAGYRKN